jgi:hypothetical protein
MTNFNMPDNFDFQNAIMSPPQLMKNNPNHRFQNNKLKKGVADSLITSPLIADLNENDFAFDHEAQSHLNKNKEALANRIKANNPKNNNNHSRPSFPGMTGKPAIINPFPLIYNEASMLNDYPNDSTQNKFGIGIADKSHYSDSLSNSQSSGSFLIFVFFSD